MQLHAARNARRTPPAAHRVEVDAERRASKSFYMAEAAVEHGRMALFAASGGAGFDDALLAASERGAAGAPAEIGGSNAVPNHLRV